MKRAEVLILHGGTGGPTTRDREARIQRALTRIAELSYEFLRRHDALESVVYAVQQLEDDPLFNAGTGSTLQHDGRARMSASVMEGAPLRFAGVLNIERVKNPVAVARILLETPDRMLAGEPATRFARASGFPDWNPITSDRVMQWRAKVRGSHGTVGAVALDADGHVAAATSTGGKGCEQPGRVSDSGLPCGNYANDDVAISCTGIGEQINDEGLAPRIAQQVLDGATLATAMRRTFRQLQRRQRQIGAIALTRRGQWAWATTLPRLHAISCTPRGYKLWKPS